MWVGKLSLRKTPVVIMVNLCWLLAMKTLSGRCSPARERLAAISLVKGDAEKARIAAFLTKHSGGPNGTPASVYLEAIEAATEADCQTEVWAIWQMPTAAGTRRVQACGREGGEFDGRGLRHGGVENKRFDENIGCGVCKGYFALANMTWPYPSGRGGNRESGIVNLSGL